MFRSTGHSPKNENESEKKGNKAEWIHGYHSRVRVGGGRIWGHQNIWAEAVKSKILKIESVTRGHNIVKDKWAGASNTIHTLTHPLSASPPLPHIHIQDS